MRRHSNYSKDSSDINFRYSITEPKKDNFTRKGEFEGEIFKKLDNFQRQLDMIKQGIPKDDAYEENFGVKKLISGASSDIEYDDEDEEMKTAGRDFFSDMEEIESKAESGIEDTEIDDDDASDLDSIDSMSSGIGQISQRDNLISNRSREYDENDHRTISLNLMNKAWSRSKCLFHIMERMDENGLINLDQKTSLRKLIVNENQALSNALMQYNNDAKTDLLYKSILETLHKSSKKENDF